jgi:putrescine transport system substrate-binding protein
MLRARRTHAYVSFTGAFALSFALLIGCARTSETDTSAASAAPAAAGAAGAPANTSANGTGIVRVYNWSEYVAEDTIPNFQSRTGLRVEYNEYTSNQVLEARLKETPTAYDVIFPSARPNAQQMLASGQLQPLDKNRLPNWKHLDPAILSELSKIDPGNRHFVPYMWGTTGLGMNVEQVKAALGPNASLDSWSLLFDPGSASKLSKCGIGVMDDVLEALSPALIWRGYGVNDHSDAANAAAERVYMNIRPYIRKFTGSTELISDLAEGNLCLALSFSGDIVQSQARAVELGKKHEIRYVVPREGALRWTDVMAIPKQAQHANHAHAFIDYMMEPKVIAAVSNYVAYANANRGSIELLDPAVSKDTSIYPSAATLAKLQTLQVTTPADYDKRNQVWNRVVYGHLP